MHTVMIRSPNLFVEKTTGNEGPRNDRCGFTEYNIHVRRRLGAHHAVVVTALVHFGLVNWIRANGRPFDMKLAHDGLDDDRFRQFVRIFTGYTIEQLERFANKAAARCRCGSKSHRAEAGMPGETLVICNRCDAVRLGSFHEDAVA